MCIRDRVEGEVVAEEPEVSEEQTELHNKVEEAITSEEEVIEEEEEAIEVNVEDDINALISGQELSEEFQEKARMIFETAINSKVAVIKEEMEKKYEEALQEGLEAVSYTHLTLPTTPYV